MSELLPCPFCGGEARIERDHDSENLKERWSIWHECCEHEGESMGYGHALFPWHETPWYETEAEAIAAWNTRYHSTFEETVIKAWEGIKNYTERTCEAEYRSGGYGIGGWYCSACGGYMHDDMQQDMAYCPNCGAKVVEQ